MLTEGFGLPIGHGIKRTQEYNNMHAEDVLLTMRLLPPIAIEEDPLHLYADKGYDYDDIRFHLAACGYYAHIHKKAAKTHFLRY